MLKTRIFTSIFLMQVLIGAAFCLPDLAWELFMLEVIALAAWEWGALAQLSYRGQVMFTVFVALSILLMIPRLWPASFVHFSFVALFWGTLLAVVFWLLVVPISLLLRQRLTGRLYVVPAGVLVLLPTWLALTHLRNVNPWLLLALMLTVWIADSAAFFVGKRFGRHKLAPDISPGKTWEGVAGAWVGVTVYGLLLCHFLNFDYWLLVGLWALTVMSIIGDLFESMLKRNAGIKDSGSILPGHGGILDRIDGLTAALPIAAFYIFFPLYVSALR
jgi:phosphatidate cytidylyltransferase